MKYGPPNRDVRVLSEKMKNASIHHETEYAVFMKSNIFASSQRPRARANDPDAIDKKEFRALLLICNVYTHCIQNPMNLYTLCVHSVCL